MSNDEAKRAVALRAADLVEDGMAVGLGTGSTVTHLVDELGRRAPRIVCVATSLRTEQQARACGLTVAAADDLERLDVTIDGADEVDRALNLTKGGGGAHLRERVVAALADRFVVIADESKLVPVLGPFGTPLEIAPFAPHTSARAVEALGARTVTFRDESSDNGNLLADALFGEIADPAALATALNAVPGVVDHGIFLGAMVDRVLVDGPGGPATLTHER